ncbi:VOC family protein [Kineosporia sp. A_224]|uniref:VOC family protein n=1 Tax=Kineosporia sp. A_224 TaxID=1962180 RepID=UPI0013043D34|nr:VOC family protein [Kineosporia sp. A_224]
MSDVPAAPDRPVEPGAAARPRFTLVEAVLGAPDPVALAAFWCDLLGWRVARSSPEWVVVRPPDGGTGLAFQLETDHVRPTWPAGPGDQQMQEHLDVRVDDLAAGVDRAVALGARLAEHQPQDDVRVLLDPAGHPFCLFAG